MTDIIFRILGPTGEIEKGQSPPRISGKDLIYLYRLMLLNRRLDERMIKLQRQGRIGFYVGSEGEEAAIIGSAFTLQKNDWIFPCYREIGAALVQGFTLLEFCCQLFGNIGDGSKGRQMPNHFCSKKLRIGSISSPVGTQILHATGVGMAARMRKTSDVALAYFGDGASSTGDFHSGLNFAGVYKSSTVFLCRNNQWAISVPLKAQTRSKSIAAKAEAYGIEGIRVDGNDIFGVYQVTNQAVKKARRGDGPTLIEAVTYRLGAHTTSDDPRLYRDTQEVENRKLKDPISRFKKYLLKNGYLTEEKDQALEKEIKDTIQLNITKAESMDSPLVKEMFEDVYDDTPWHIQEQFQELQTLEKVDTIK